MGNKKIYILLTDTGTLFTRMIKLYTKSPLNHASISFDEDLEELYSFGRKHERIPFIGGFVQENIHHTLFQKAKCAVYSYSVSELEFYRLKRNIQKMQQNKENYKYNLIGLFGVMVNKEMARENAFFCSQFVATLLQESGITIVEKPSALVTPQDLSEAKNLVLEFEGDLCSYSNVHSALAKETFFEYLRNKILGKKAKTQIKNAYERVKAYI